MVPEPVALIGGTGDLGQSLARQFAYHGVDTVIGSRKREKAERIADELRSPELDGQLSGTVNGTAAARATFVVLTIPFWAHESILSDLASKLEDKDVLDTSVPMADDSPTEYDEPPEGSAGAFLREQLPDSTRLATGFHTVSAHSLGEPPSEPASDVFYCGNESTKEIVGDLLEVLDFEGYDAGDLSRSGTLERLTPMLIHFNIQYDRSDIGLRLV